MPQIKYDEIGPYFDLDDADELETRRRPNRQIRRSLRPVVDGPNVERQNRSDTRPAKTERARRVRARRRAERNARKVQLHA